MPLGFAPVGLDPKAMEYSPGLGFRVLGLGPRDTKLMGTNLQSFTKGPGVISRRSQKLPRPGRWVSGGEAQGLGFQGLNNNVKHEGI